VSDSQSVPTVNHIHTTKKDLPDITANKVKSETSFNNMQSNYFITLIMKTCIKLYPKLELTKIQTKMNL
jgi:hypothetical protein